MNQIGCVLVFKPGADPNEIIRKLKALEDVADLTYNTPADHKYRDKPFAKNLVLAKDGKSVIASLHKFDKEFSGGGPVWYIP